MKCKDARGAWIEDMKEDQGKTSILSKKQMSFMACRADHDVLLCEKASCEQKYMHYSI